jgi:hypothetical protein
LCYDFTEVATENITMPHPNVLKQLETYGPMAQELDRLTDQVGDLFGKGASRPEALKEFRDFCKSHDVSDVVVQLAKDKYAYNRELAAITIWDIWMLPYLDVTFSVKEPSAAYQNRLADEAKNYAWTKKILFELLGDSKQGPAELALRAVHEMSEVDPDVVLFRKRLCEVFSTSRSPSVRLEVIRCLPDLYPVDDDILQIVDDDAVACLIQATKDSDAEVRNWACFMLWSHTDNLSSKIEKALEAVLNSEPYNSEIYCEALTALARFGRADIDDIICEQLAAGTCTVGWFYAVINSHSERCFDSLIALYEQVCAEPDQDGINDVWYDAIESAISDWNDEGGLLFNIQTFTLQS